MEGGVDISLCVGLNENAVPNTGLIPGTGLSPGYMYGLVGVGGCDP